MKNIKVEMISNLTPSLYSFVQKVTEHGYASYYSEYLMSDSMMNGTFYYLLPINVFGYGEHK